MGTNATQSQAGSGADASGGGAGGGQQRQPGGVPRFNPAAGVDSLGGGSNGQSPVDSGDGHGSTPGGVDSPKEGSGPSLADLQQQLQQQAQLIESLKRDRDDAARKRDKTRTRAQSLEEQLAAVNASVEQLRSEKASEASERRRIQAVDSALEQVPADQRKLAKAVIWGLQNAPQDPIDLAGEDHASVVKAVVDRLKSEHPSLMKAPETDLPEIKSSTVVPGGVKVQRMPLDENGNRLI